MITVWYQRDRGGTFDPTGFAYGVVVDTDVKPVKSDVVLQAVLDATGGTVDFTTDELARIIQRRLDWSAMTYGVPVKRMLPGDCVQFGGRRYARTINGWDDVTGVQRYTAECEHCDLQRVEVMTRPAMERALEDEGWTFDPIVCPKCNYDRRA